jgi:hypothetical protein
MGAFNRYPEEGCATAAYVCLVLDLVAASAMRLGQKAASIETSRPDLPVATKTGEETRARNTCGKITK